MTIQSDCNALIAERLAPQPVDVVGFERGAVFVRMLSDELVTASRIAAFKHVEAECKREGVRILDLAELDPEIHDRERMIQTVHRAFVDPDTYDADFPEAAKSAFALPTIRAMDSVLVDELYDVYLAYQATRTIRVNLDPEAVAELAAKLREPGNEAALSALDENGLRTLVMALVRGS